MKSVYLIIFVACSTYVSGMPSKIPMNPDAMDNMYLFSAGMKYKDMDNLCNSRDLSPYDSRMMECYELVMINGKLVKCYNAFYVVLVNGNVTLKKGKNCDTDHIMTKSKKNFDEIDKASNSFSTLNQLI